MESVNYGRGVIMQMQMRMQRTRLGVFAMRLRKVDADHQDKFHASSSLHDDDGDERSAIGLFTRQL